MKIHNATSTIFQITILLALNTIPIGAIEETEPGIGIEQKYFNSSYEPGAILFNPPDGWHVADPKALPPSVKLMVVGQGSQIFPPSINLGSERFTGTLKDYLETVKAINDSQGAEWKDLGNINTQAGNASLSQVDTKTEWGEVRMMHVILIKNEVAYILTAAALKDEFPKFYKEFFKSMRSLRFNKDLIEMIPDSSRRKTLSRSTEQLRSAWEKLFENERGNQSTLSVTTAKERLFESDQFQNNYWKPFQEMLEENYQDLGNSWRDQMLTHVKKELTTLTTPSKGQQH